MPDFIDTYFILIFPILWAVICKILSYMGGWHTLAQKFKRNDFVAGEKWRLRSAVMRLSVSYSGCLNFAANSEGLGISILFLFRVGHPSLFIPWREISICRETRFFRRMVCFYVGKKFPIPIKVYENFGDTIRKVVGPNWPEINT